MLARPFGCWLRKQRVREFELPGSEAVMRKEGPRLVIEPAARKSLSEILKSLEPIDEKFPEIEDPPPEEVDL